MARGKYEKPRARTNVNWKLIGLGLLVVVVCLAIYFIAFTPKDNEPGTMSAPSTTAPTAPPETQPTEPPEPYVTTTASVGVTGDVLMHSAVFNSAHVGNGEYDFNEIFTYISDYYKQYDFMVANMEGTLSGAAKGYSGYPQFNCPDAIVDALKNAGVDMLLSANNHTYDHGHSGFLRTQEVFQEKGMPYLGTRTSTETPNYIVQDINGIKVGMICYTYETETTSAGNKTLNGIPIISEDRDLVSTFHYNKLDQFYTEVDNALKAMKDQGAEATMIYIHWGNEYQLKQNQQQETIAQNLCELGVDVIVGGHPHVLQPFKTLTSTSGHETYCIYSLGNAISNQRRTNISSTPKGHCEDSMIFGVTFQKWNDGSVTVAEIDILPIWVSKETKSGQGDVFYIIPLDVEAESWEGFDIASSAKLYESYQRTMEIVGEGLNACRESLGLAPAPLSMELETAA